MPDNYEILNLDYETVDNISKTLDEERVVFENELSLGSSDSLTTIYINGDMDCMVDDLNAVRKLYSSNMVLDKGMWDKSKEILKNTDLNAIQTGK